ncbi:hypothetical protein POM88_034578 [Heracleum sosnowskyi]|uniref:Uncharacterized protein n=1 Tax=Heracleum sosnowskyi TaxID=360622 RepID=A0AAD8HKT9_9APIA|nr:hypothetical protein POM88_034578 [Heracleum sosnowskyi]
MVRGTRSRKSFLEANQTPAKNSTSIVDVSDTQIPESGDEVSNTPESKKIKMHGRIRITTFQDFGWESFWVDMPKVYYPDLIKEYYAILRTDKFGNVYSVVTGFTEVDQLKVLLGNVRLKDDNPHATIVVVHLAHLLFKLARSHICPRSGNKSNFTRHGVIVVSMLMTEVGEPSSAVPASNTSVVKLLHSLQDDNGLMMSKLIEMASDITDLKNGYQDITAELMTLKAMVKDFKNMFGHFIGSKSFTAQSTKHELEDLVDALVYYGGEFIGDENQGGENQ